MTDLKTHLHATIHRHPAKSVPQIADDLGISSSYLYRAALPCEGETATGCRFPLDLLIPLVRSTGDYQVLDYLEAAVGRVAIALPSGTAGTRELALQTCRVVKEFGETASAAGAAIADGKVTRREAEVVEREALEAVREIMALVEAVKAAVKP